MEMLVLEKPKLKKIREEQQYCECGNELLSDEEKRFRMCRECI